MTTTQENRGKTFKKAAAVVLLAAAIVAGGGATAATAGWGHSVGGGTWNYFKDHNANTNVSQYLHPTAYHRASVRNPGYGTVRAYASSGRWATASQHQYAYGNQAFWYRY